MASISNMQQPTTVPCSVTCGRTATGSRSTGFVGIDHRVDQQPAPDRPHDRRIIFGLPLLSAHDQYAIIWYEIKGKWILEASRMGTEYRLDELARQADVASTTVRLYQSKGLLAPPRLEGRTGWYDDSHLARLRLIARLQDEGHSLAGIADLLAKWEQGRNLDAVMGVEAELDALLSDVHTIELDPADLAAKFPEGALSFEDYAARCVARTRRTDHRRPNQDRRPALPRHRRSSRRAGHPDRSDPGRVGSARRSHPGHRRTVHHHLRDPPCSRELEGRSG